MGMWCWVRMTIPVREVALDISPVTQQASRVPRLAPIAPIANQPIVARTIHLPLSRDLRGGEGRGEEALVL
jgi:hypothetical protein